MNLFSISRIDIRDCSTASGRADRMFGSALLIPLVSIVGGEITTIYSLNNEINDFLPSNQWHYQGIYLQRRKL